MRILSPTRLLPVCAFIATVAFVSGTGQADPTPPPCMKPCPAPPSWFPVTPKPLYEKPDPDSDCDFYKAAWQTLLYITQPDTPSGTMARFLSFETKDDLYGGQVASRFPKAGKPTLLLAPRLKKQKMPLSSSDILQAQSQGLLVDKSGRAVYYSIHLNDVFANFIRSNGYTDFIKSKFAPGDYEFPRGSLELKASWRIVPDDEPAEVTAKYFVVSDAMVSKLKLNANGQIEIDPNDTASARVALLGIHVVAILDGHPEFVWATFEHSDNAPDGSTKGDNTANQDPDKPIDTKGKEFILYKKGTIASECNNFGAADVKNLKLNEKTQTLSPPSRVFRLFPFGEDESPCTIQDLNDSVHQQILALKTKIPKAQFDRLSVWRNYDLKGAIWLNNPAY
ncbi:MAG: hypothetical protein JWM11_6210, partial [Planctomycetaceae bacterium]|nr:hypothetical protein [Planctomycetaceae bacterium]